MHKGLLSTLSYMYRYLCLARGKMDRAELASIAGSAGAMAGHAAEVLEPQEGDDLRENRLDIEQAQLVDQHIEEMVEWLIKLEIV